MAKEKSFEIQTNGHRIPLKAGRVVSNLFRKNPEVDHLMIDLDHYPSVGEGVLRLFNNEDLTRWMAGVALRETIRGHFKPDLPEISGNTFRENYGWNAAVIIREEPSEQEKQWYTEVMTEEMDKEWEKFNEEYDDGA